MVRSITAFRQVFSSSTVSVWNHFENAAKPFAELLKRIFETPAGYFLKISVFRSAAMQDRFSKWIVEPAALTLLNVWQKMNGIPHQHVAVDSKRLENSAAFLREFGEVRFIKTTDGKILSWVCYRPENFEKWIRENGGLRFGEWIVPRRIEDWQRLKRLGEFRWFEQKGQAFRVPAPIAGAHNICVLRCQGFGRTIAMDKNYIGVHLAAGFNYAVFDWRDELSIKGYFQDAENAYQAALHEGFSPAQIKIMGSCRATFPATYLKERHHDEGVDAVLIQPPPSLREMIAKQMVPANWIGLLGLGTIEKGGDEHFDSIRRLRGLRPGTGRLCLVMSEGDGTLPENTWEQFKNAASHAGPFEVIWEPKNNSGSDPHFDEPLRKPHIFKRYTEYLTSKASLQFPH
jgi:hypothetical protein